MPSPFIRCATVRGPSPASISMTPLGVRTMELFPADPLPSTHNSIDIRVLGYITRRALRAAAPAGTAGVRRRFGSHTPSGAMREGGRRATWGFVAGMIDEYPSRPGGSPMRKRLVGMSLVAIVSLCCLTAWGAEEQKQGG